VSHGRCPETSGVHRPMTILAEERQLGQRVSPKCEQIVALGVAPWPGTVGHFGPTLARALNIMTPHFLTDL
jgi:hypothetical protein